mmetsp:Transcript_15259/g.38832  ORF Transcript_15259/g.38832 Transcript_15259/m.38832 type:complete len:140 (-) Transcript_15259:293-712(-)
MHPLACAHAHSLDAPETGVPRMLHTHTYTTPLTLPCALDLLPLLGGIGQVPHSAQPPSLMRAPACTHQHNPHAHQVRVPHTLHTYTYPLPLTFLRKRGLLPLLCSIRLIGIWPAMPQHQRPPTCTHQHRPHTHKTGFAH